MNEAFYNEVAAQAQTLLTEFGQPVTVGRPSADFDPVASETSNVTATQMILRGVTVSAKLAQRLLESSFDNAAIKDLIAGKVRGLILSAVGATFEPTVNDIAVFGGSNWRVLGCTPVAPGGIPVIYKLLVQLTDIGLSNVITPPSPTGQDVWTEIAALEGEVAALQAVDADERFEFMQPVPSALWIINHNLGRSVDVAIYDTGGNRLEADIVEMSANQIQISFNPPIAGKAICN